MLATKSQMISTSSLIILFSFFVNRTLQTGESKLHADLLQGYSKYARPVRDISKPVVVTFGFELVHIVSVTESKQTITQKVWLRMSWKNELLTWDPKMYGNVSVTRLSYSSVWIPDIYLQEDVASDMAVGPDRYKTQVVISSDGSARWYIPTLLESSCTFNVQSFPFDNQTCYLTFTPWTHDQSELDLRVDPKPVITSNYIKSSEWDLVSVKSKLRSTKYLCCPNPFVDITYTINLRRKPLYYVYQVIVPCLIQMVIILFTFFLPPDSGERIGVVITVLLVFAVYLEVLSESLPRTSTSTPALSRFYIAAMAESAVSLIATCLVLILHFKGTSKGVGPMPNWVRRYFIDGLAWIICTRPKKRCLDDGKLAVDEKGSYKGLNNINLNHKIDNDLKEKIVENGEGTMDALLDEVRQITAVIKDQDKQDEIEVEWQLLARVFDRLFFFAFVIIFVSSSLILLVPVYNN